MLLYFITDRRQFPGDEAARRRALLSKIAEAARCGVDFIQLREKDLKVRELESLAREAVQVVRENSGHSKLLVNSRIDVALACGADGVHLPADDLAASDARAIWDQTHRRDAETQRNSDGTPCLRASVVEISAPVIAVSCHHLEEVLAAESHGADFAVFGPVFEKDRRAGVGLAALEAICRRGLAPDPKTEAAAVTARLPVLALGGVTLANALSCIAAGAAGIAAIRLFQEKEICRVLEELTSAYAKRKT